MDLLKSMSLSDKYSHRPPIPTAEQILFDFNSAKSRTETDPVFKVSDEELPTMEVTGKLRSSCKHSNHI